MSIRLNLQQLEAALNLLGERLHLSGLPPQELIVCGGTSLIARGYVSRATRDVDVLARRSPGTEFVSARDLPLLFVQAAERVAADLGLPVNWLNTGPVELFEMGVPAGLVDRLEAKTYGAHLTIWYIGRLDQIHFKLYAAADQGAGRHLSDLLALQPNAEELLVAAKWAMTHDVSPAFRELLRALLKEIHHEAIADKI